MARVGSTTDGAKLPKHIFKDAVKWLMLPSKVILDCLSVWPERQNAVTVVLHFCCVSSFVLVLIGQFLYITDKDVDLGSAAYAISVMIVSIETTVRRLLCYIYRKRLTKILQIIYYEFWPSDIAGKQLHDKLNWDSWFLLLYCSGYTLSAVMFGIQIMINPIQTGNLPLRTKFPMKNEWKEVAYAVLYVWQSFMGIELVFNICGLDLFLVSLVANCVAQYRLLSVYLHENFRAALEDHDSSSGNAAAMQVVLKCIRHHKKLISVCKEMDGVFTYFILVQYLTSMGTVCLSSFVATAAGQEFGTSLTYFMGHICEIFIYCYMGENLIFESTGLSNAIFECGWHLANPDKELRKTLILMMVRSQRAIKMSAGGFGYLSLAGFMKLIQFSFSVYTLLYRMMQKQKNNVNKP